MRFLMQVFLAIVFLSIIACGSDQSSSNQQETATERGVDTTVTPSSFDRAMPTCDIQGSVLEGNKFWARDAQVLVVIKADSSTYSEDLQAEGHRILEVYNTENCQRIDRHVLPVDQSPDFAYFIAEITYNTVTKIVAIRGATTIYCYDVANKKLLPKLTPKFRSERYAVDAQSGHIQRLEVWEDYLLGYAQDYGTFAFSLKNRQNPEAILPFAEYAMSEVEFAPLFMLSVQGGEQVIMPEYSRETGEFAINPAFDQPVDLNTNIQKSATNNRYLVLRQQNNNQAVAFDLQQHQRVDLPADVATKGTQDVLSWMRSNVQ